MLRDNLQLTGIPDFIRDLFYIQVSRLREGQPALDIQSGAREDLTDDIHTFRIVLFTRLNKQPKHRISFIARQMMRPHR